MRGRVGWFIQIYVPDLYILINWSLQRGVALRTWCVVPSTNVQLVKVLQNEVIQNEWQATTRFPLFSKDT